MNIYVRFFDHETIVHSVGELFDFLAQINDITLTQTIIDDIYSYLESNVTFPKRCNVRTNVYIILIRTTAETLEEFKANRPSDRDNHRKPENFTKQIFRDSKTEDEAYGWYKGDLTFKRVVLIPGTQKFQYKDTQFSAYVLADSQQQCYDNIIHHLKNRQDVDSRSQYPSMRGNSFRCKFIGEAE